MIVSVGETRRFAFRAKGAAPPAARGAGDGALSGAHGGTRGDARGDARGGARGSARGDARGGTRGGARGGALVGDSGAGSSGREVFQFHVFDGDGVHMFGDCQAAFEHAVAAQPSPPLSLQRALLRALAATCACACSMFIGAAL